MTRIVWKEHHIISIETRRGLYTLAQMSREPYLVFYNIFRNENTWDGFDLTQTPVLFTKAVTRQFLLRSAAGKQTKVRFLPMKTLPTRWIHQAKDGGRYITLWKGTKDERTCVTLGEGGLLVETDVYNHKGGPYKHFTGVCDAVIRKIPPTDTKTIEQHECDSLAVFPATNERLYQCHLARHNVDPEKYLLFNLPMPDEYMTYVDLGLDNASGKYAAAAKLFRNKL